MSAGRVAVVGGGLAGIAAALALSEAGLAVDLFETRRQLGGRAASFRDPESGEMIDHCQHVAMGCCTNFLDFCRKVGAECALRRAATLHFFGPDGRRCDFRAARGLPAPLHLLPGLLRLTFLSPMERLAAVRALGRLAAERGAGAAHGSFDAWLRARGQSQSAIENFWSLVLTSALSETLDQVSVAAARKVFVEGFMTAAGGYEIYVPTVQLVEFYDRYVLQALLARGVSVRMGTAVVSLEGGARGVGGLTTGDGCRSIYDDYILATTWRQAAGLLDAELVRQAPEVQRCASLTAGAITAVHLWFDQPITPLDHAVFAGRLSQWMFARRPADASDGSPSYYQIVISAAHAMQIDRQPLLAGVLADLAAIFPKSAHARLIRSRVVSDRDAVFSPSEENERLRPQQTTAIGNLFLAGDWTATGWPATMEGAVRSGRLAANALLRRRGMKERALAPDLPPSAVARWIVRGG